MDVHKFNFKNFNWTAVGFAGIWLAFLLYPLTEVWGSPSLESWQKWLAITSTFLFCTLYLVSFGANDLLAAKTQPQRTLKWSLLLLIPALIQLIFVGPWAIYFSTYFVAKWAFQNKPSVGISVGLIITVVGLLSIAFIFPPEFRSSGYSFFFGAIFVLVMALLNWRLDQRRELANQLLEAQTSEKIARDVHDLLGHSLTVINLKAEVAAVLVETDPAQAKEELAQINTISRTALAEVRATVTRMKSPNLTGEIEASRRALETAQIRFRLPSSDEAAQAGNNSTLFTWVLRESITNILRHSHATACWVFVEPERIEIVDNGVNAQIDEGNGLSGLRNRVLEAGGDLHAVTGSQTRIMVSMNGNFTSIGNTG